MVKLERVAQQCNSCGVAKKAYWWAYCPACGKRFEAPADIEVQREVAPEVVREEP